MFHARRCRRCENEPTCKLHIQLPQLLFDHHTRTFLALHTLPTNTLSQIARLRSVIYLNSHAHELVLIGRELVTLNNPCPISGSTSSQPPLAGWSDGVEYDLKNIP